MVDIWQTVVYTSTRYFCAAVASWCTQVVYGLCTDTIIPHLATSMWQRYSRKILNPSLTITNCPLNLPAVSFYLSFAHTCSFKGYVVPMVATCTVSRVYLSWCAPPVYSIKGWNPVTSHKSKLMTSVSTPGLLLTPYISDESRFKVFISLRLRFHTAARLTSIFSSIIRKTAKKQFPKCSTICLSWLFCELRKLFLFLLHYVTLKEYVHVCQIGTLSASFWQCVEAAFFKIHLKPSNLSTFKFCSSVDYLLLQVKPKCSDLKTGSDLVWKEGEMLKKYFDVLLHIHALDKYFILVLPWCSSVMHRSHLRHSLWWNKSPAHLGELVFSTERAVWAPEPASGRRGGVIWGGVASSREEGLEDKKKDAERDEI